MKKITKKIIIEKLTEVLDPEINISIVDLGLIYKIELIEKKVIVTMTLTTIGCPLYDLIESEIKQKLKELGFSLKNIKLKLVFEPPWSLDKISPRGKALLGI